MAKLFLVLGTPGAGKSAVLNGLKGVEILNVGTEMLEVYRKESGKIERDSLKAIAVARYADVVRIRNRLFGELAKRKGTVAIDTHASVKSGNAYIPGFSPEDLKTLKGQIQAIVYIDAETKDILERRAKDKTRKREQDSVEVLNQHREINIALTTTYSLYLGAPLYVINNGDSLQETQEEVSKVIRTF
jgi:adenylate kinase